MTSVDWTDALFAPLGHLLDLLHPFDNTPGSLLFVSCSFETRFNKKFTKWGDSLKPWDKSFNISNIGHHLCFWMLNNSAKNLLFKYILLSRYFKVLKIRHRVRLMIVACISFIPFKIIQLHIKCFESFLILLAPKELSTL